MMKKISAFVVFLLSLAVCLVFRFLQINLMTDSSTGFLITQYESTNYIMYGLLIAFAVLLILLMGLGKNIGKIRTRSPLVGIASIFLGAVSGYMTVSLALGSTLELGVIIYIFAALFFAVYMIYFGICKIMGIALLSGTALIPVIFSGIRLAVVFLDFYGLAKTVDIVVELMMLMVSLLFWLYFSKYAVSINQKSNPGLAHGFALAGALFCIVSALPTICQNAAAQPSRGLATTYYFDIACAVFMLIVFFSAENVDDSGATGVTKDAD